MSLIERNLKTEAADVDGAISQQEPAAKATHPCVSIRDVSILFGDSPKKAMPLVLDGESREAIHDKTGQILGVARADLEVRQGEVLVLMGLSGSGKSTLLRGINGLNLITHGEITIQTDDGLINVADCSKATLRKLRTESVAMVFQQFGLLPWRSVADNVGFGLEVAGVPKAERAQRVSEQLELVGLDQWADKMVDELSGGMQQRVGLARAFATGAPILLMDEPYSALDPLIRAHLQDELLLLQRKLNCTIIFVSHDLDEALKIGNRIAIMEGGRIVQVGTPQDIILKPADRYVADFVAHMNPMQVLRAREIMRPLAETSARQEGDYLIWRERSHMLVAYDGSEPAELAGLNGLDLPEGGILTIGSDTSMKTILALRLQSGWPLLVRDGTKPIGLIGEEDIYKALIR